MTTTTPEYVRVREMDEAVRLVESAQRLADLMAAEAGYERVRIENVREGDVLVDDGRDWTVVGKQVYVDPPAEWFRVTVHDLSVGQHTLTFDAGEFVSRRLPETNEAF
jgi:hypothetical protein